MKSRLMEGEAFLKINAFSRHEFNDLLERLSENYKIIQQSRVLENDRDTGVHAFITITIETEEGD